MTSHATTCPTCRGRGQIMRPPSVRPMMRAIIKAVSTVTGMPTAAITGPRRTRDLVIARDMIAELAWRAGYSGRQIGRALGGRDSSTIVQSRRRATRAMTRDAQFAGDVRWADEISRGGPTLGVAAE